MSKSWKGGSTRAYRALRARLLALNAYENRGQCEVAIVGVCTGEATEVHHVRGKRYGDDPRHMIPSCRACNLSVGDPNRGAPAPRPVTRWGQ